MDRIRIKWTPLRRRGFLIGPQESSQDFLTRVEALNHFFSFPPAECDAFVTDGEWKPALDRVEELFGIRPDWIVAFYSNKKLPFYQGGAAWIEEKKGIRFPLVQLRRRFFSAPSSLREEILAHEAVHCARLAFDEPLFEEFFAYQTSRHWLRRFFGPLFQSNREALLFILSFFLPLISLSGALWIDWPWLWESIAFLPWVVTGFFLFRLGFCHVTFRLARKKAETLFGKQTDLLGILLGLTDREIVRLAYRSDSQWIL